MALHLSGRSLCYLGMVGGRTEQESRSPCAAACQTSGYMLEPGSGPSSGLLGGYLVCLLDHGPHLDPIPPSLMGQGILCLSFSSFLQ